MDRIEEVKKILEQEVGTFDSESHTYLDDKTRAELAKQICQLFEPKPDQSRLLTDDMKVIIAERTKNCASAPYESVKENLEWLVAKTASIMDKKCADERAEFGLSVNEAAVALCEARIETLIEAYDGMLDGMGRNSVDHFKVSDWNYVQELKATYTSKVKRNTSEDPELGQE